tara:strand:- start:1030 stop:1752 length:723 start_codon:yes stop_codon:yes gene_type:complete
MILITRPRIEALKLKNKLADLNIKSLIDPMLSYTNFQSSIPYSKNAYYLVASVKAVEAMVNSSDKDKILESAKFITIGDKSAQFLKNNGVRRGIKTFEDSSQLIKSLSNKNNAKKLFYLCGSQYNKLMLEDLKNLGIQTQLVQVYKTVKKNKFNNSTLDNLVAKKIKAITFYSKSAVASYFDVLGKTGNMLKGSKYTYICISNNVGAEVKNKAGNKWIKKLLIAKKPNNAAMIEAIQKIS